MTDYIPKLATIEQSCEWLRARLGGVWILPRLLECHLKPYFWIDYKPGHPQIFGGKVEGYLTWMVFASDVHRLEVDGTNALVNIFTAHDGTLVKIEPGWTVPLSDLRFKREALERVASILEGEVSRQNPASSGAPEATESNTTHKATPARWIENVRAIALEYIAKHKAKDLFPSQSDVCGYIAKVAREKKIYGPQGKPLSQRYIQRNAIQGDWWKQNKP